MSPTLIEAMGILLIGMGGVFAALGFFYLLILFMNRLNARTNKKKVEKKLHPTMEGITNANPDDIDSEILAVISAAIFATIQEKVKIKTIKFLTQPDDTSWSRIGRLSLIESHIIKK